MSQEHFPLRYTDEKLHRKAVPQDVWTGGPGFLFWLSSCEVNQEPCCNVGSSTLAGKPKTKKAQDEPTVAQGKFLMFLLQIDFQGNRQTLQVFLKKTFKGAVYKFQAVNKLQSASCARASVEREGEFVLMWPLC